MQNLSDHIVVDEPRPEYNERMPMIWSVIERSVEFEGKRVIDLGCGAGDLCMRVHTAGAELTVGVDKDLVLVRAIRAWFPSLRKYVKGLDFKRVDIDKWVTKGQTFRPRFDIAFCMSVLPYLFDRDATLLWLRKTFDRTVIECQYWGDGPGLASLKNDDDMREWLRWAGWSSVEMIGGSHVESRNKIRSIWLCSDD